MATTISDIETMLRVAGLKYTRRSDMEILTGFGGLDNYRNSNNEPALTLVIKLSEGGEYFTLFAPMAYEVEGRRAPMFLQACAMVQWKTKLIQFEYDARDGEVRPVIEFPLEDASLTPKQLMRCMRGMAQLVDQYHSVLERVLDEGVIEFEGTDPRERFDELLALLGAAEALSESSTSQSGNAQDNTPTLRAGLKIGLYRL